LARSGAGSRRPRRFDRRSLLDEALRALLARHRAGEIDPAYGAYDDHPLDEPGEWGDLAAFREAAATS
jgi:hypothetical protein